MKYAERTCDLSILSNIVLRGNMSPAAEVKFFSFLRSTAFVTLCSVFSAGGAWTGMVYGQKVIKGDVALLQVDLKNVREKRLPDLESFAAAQHEFNESQKANNKQILDEIKSLNEYLRNRSSGGK